MRALFGGTFNPVHQGHIALARQVRAAFELDSVAFIPSFHSVHRAQPQATAEQREHMLRIALQPFPELVEDSCELQRQGPSFTVDTLRALKQAAPRQDLCWLMGVDAFNGFADWHRPDEILQLANLIVCARPGVALQAGRFAERFLAGDEQLTDFDAGRIALFDMSPSPCSSTRIRHQLAQGETAADCLPPAVLEFIHQQSLYR